MAVDRAVAEDWAEQLGKARLWLQEQVLAQSLELKQWKDAQPQRESALAELAALQEQLQATTKLLEQKRGDMAQLELRRCQIEQSRSFRLWRWLTGRLLPRQTIRGHLAAGGFRLAVWSVRSVRKIVAHHPRKE